MDGKLIRAARGLEPADLVLKGGRVLNVFTEEFLEADVAIVGDQIAGVGNYRGKTEIDCTGKYLVPGLIDGHMHMESTMVAPPRLAGCVVRKGTTTMIVDPHEIVNVAGTEGMEYMLESTRNVPVNIFVMIPSSVPAADIDSNGAGKILAEDMKPYLGNPRVLGLGEMMRFMDVLNEDPETLEKLELFQNRMMDGHAPGITGGDVQGYRVSGICSDHECTTADELLEKLRAGFYILIREGSAARDLEPLVKGLLDKKLPLERCMFCTDDKHLEDIEREGHINFCVKKAISLGIPPVKAYKMASYYTAAAYGLRRLGAVSAGYQADILVLEHLEEARPELVFQKGTLVDEKRIRDGFYETQKESLLHTVVCPQIKPEDLRLKVQEKNHVLEMLPKQLLTRHLLECIPEKEGWFQPNQTYSKLLAVERYGRTGRIAVCAAKGYGIQGGAVATSVSHDAHNIIAAGDNDEDILAAVEELKRMQGGYAIASGGRILASLPLPVGGLMSQEDAETVQEKIRVMTEIARNMGVARGIDPFITLSFMALPVIPEIRLTEAGLYDVTLGKLIEQQN